MANYVKGEFTGLFVSSIKFLPQSALLEAPPHLQRPPPIHFNPKTFKVRQTGPFVSSPGGPRTPRGSRLHPLAWFWDFPKILAGYLQFLTPGKACALGESREGKGRGAKRVGHVASVPAAA